MAHVTAHAAIFTTTGSLGLAANIAQLILFCRDKNQNKTPFGLTLRSLNLTDLLGSSAVCLLGIAYCMLGSALVDLALFESLIKPLYAVIALSLTLSITHVGFIALQRVIAVASPFKVKQIVTKTRCYILLAVTWIISIVLAVVVIFLHKVGFKVISGISIIFGIALMIAYTILCYKAMKRNIVNNTSENMLRRRRQSEKEVLKYSVAITIVYVICAYPVSINEFILDQTNFHLTCDFLFSINPLFDTLLYFMLSYCKRRGERANTAPVENIQMWSRRTAPIFTNQI